MKIKPWMLLVLVVFTFCGCSSNISEKNIMGKPNNKIIQEQYMTNKEVQEELNNEIYYEKFTVKDKHTDILIGYP